MRCGGRAFWGFHKACSGLFRGGTKGEGRDPGALGSNEHGKRGRGVNVECFSLC